MQKNLLICVLMYTERDSAMSGSFLKMRIT